MLYANIPTKFPVPFGNSAGAGFITPIPEASQIGVSGGRASLFDGFPPLTFLPVGGGGIAPWGADFNGLFNQITAWCRWQAAGGTSTFDATFAAKIGGYQTGAVLQSRTAGNLWMSVGDNNTTDPDATPGAPGWVGVGFIVPIQNGVYISGDDTGSADAYISAPQPAPMGYVKYQRFQVKIANANLTTAPTLNIRGVSGLLGAKLIIHPDGSALRKGELAVNMIACFLFDGNNFQLENGTSTGGGLINIQFIVTSSNYVPTAGTTKGLVFATGGGGAGGCAVSCGGGGGAAATAVALVPISGPVACTIGAGGVGTAGVGGNGSQTSFGGLVVAAGGFGAPADAGGGLGGSTGTGFIIPGGDGCTTQNTNAFGSGTGGSSFWGGGGKGAFQIQGLTGRAYGSGGGGSDSGGVGANGAPGVIMVLEF